MINTAALFLISVTHTVPSQTLDVGINYINATSLNIREQPNSNSKVVGKKIYRQGVDVLEYRGNWAKIKFYDSTKSKLSEKWISADFLVATQPDRSKNKYELNAIREQIPRSTTDKAAYFLLYAEKSNNNLITLHERVSSLSTGYTKTEINCRSKEFRVLGYTERHIENIYYDDTASKWTLSLHGSSKSDLIHYACSTKL